MIPYQRSFTRFVFGPAVLALFALAAPQARAGFTLGDAANFAILYTGNGNHQLSTTNVTVNGNIGIGDPSGTTTAFLAASGPGTLNGDVLYAGVVSANQSISNTTITGMVSGGNANVQTDLTNLGNLSSTLGSEAGAPLSVNLNNNQSQTIDASSGTLDPSGNRVFTVSSFTFNNGATLTINGDGLGQTVVINFPVANINNPQFGGTILLTGGLKSDQVLFNLSGGNSSTLTGGPTLQINTNGATAAGTFLDPNGTISVVHSVLNGRVFGGDSANMQIVSGDTITAPPITITSVPEPSSLIMGSCSALLGLGYLWRRRNRARV